MSYVEAAYHDGWKAGQADKRMGLKLDTGSLVWPTDSEYAQAYTHGYRVGWQQARQGDKL